MSRGWRWPYDTPRWRKLRKRVLARDRGRCQDCGIPGNVVHHIQCWQREGGSVWDPDNLQTLCGGCHQVKHLHRRRRPETPGRAEWRAWEAAVRL